MKHILISLISGLALTTYASAGNSPLTARSVCEGIQTAKLVDTGYKPDCGKSGTASAVCNGIERAERSKLVNAGYHPDCSAP